jgi:hypothetical protein
MRNICPATCQDCTYDLSMSEEEHTIIARGNPDRSMTYTRKGYRCNKKSFFFNSREFIHEEEKIVNNFVNQKI